MNMYNWLENAISRQNKKPLPILSFPGIHYMEGVTVRQLVNSSRLQADCMKLVAEKCDSAAAVSFMDLSVEAEAFGAQVCFFDDEVPAVRGALVTTMEEAEALSDRIAIMKDGKLLLCGTAKEIKTAAGTEDFEQAFIRIVKEGVK